MGLSTEKVSPLQHAARDHPEILAAGLVLANPADACAADAHGPAHQGAAVSDAGQQGELGRQRQHGGLDRLLHRLPVAEQLGTVPHQLQHLFAHRGGVEVFEAQHADEFFLLKQGTVQTRAHAGIGQIVVLTQHGLVRGFRKAQGLAGAQGADVATVAANGGYLVGSQGKDRGQLLAAEGAVGLIVPEDEAIGPQALLEGLQHGGKLLLARHLAQARQLQR